MNAIAKRQEVPPAPVSETASILQVIERAALNPEVDIEKMERLFAMHQNMLAKQAERDFNVAMQETQQEMPAVLRDAENVHTKSRYAKLDTIIMEINPVITKHGFSMSFGTGEPPSVGTYRVTCDVSHIGGHTRHYQADVPADIGGSQGKANKNATQAFGSALTYGRRYLTTMIFNIAISNEDDDGSLATNTERQPPPRAPSPAEAAWLQKINGAKTKAELTKVIGDIEASKPSDVLTEALRPQIRRRKEEIIQVPESYQGRQPPAKPADPPHDTETGEIFDDEKTLPEHLQSQHDMQAAESGEDDAGQSDTAEPEERASDAPTPTEGGLNASEKWRDDSIAFFNGAKTLKAIDTYEEHNVATVRGKHFPGDVGDVDRSIERARKRVASPAREVDA